MKKRLLFSCIKELTFMLQSSTGYNVDFVYRKKARELNFCVKYIKNTQKIYFNGFNTSICFQIIRPIIFSVVFFLDQGGFPHKRVFP